MPIVSLQPHTFSRLPSFALDSHLHPRRLPHLHASSCPILLLLASSILYIANPAVFSLKFPLDQGQLHPHQTDFSSTFLRRCLLDLATPRLRPSSQPYTVYFLLAGLPLFRLPHRPRRAYSAQSSTRVRDTRNWLASGFKTHRVDNISSDSQRASLCTILEDCNHSAPGVCGPPATPLKSLPHAHGSTGL